MRINREKQRENIGQLVIGVGLTAIGILYLEVMPIMVNLIMSK
ncbi:MAG: hypothetical protein ACRC1P_09810 [Cellulosilyticaceae bacterium]